MQLAIPEVFNKKIRRRPCVRATSIFALVLAMLPADGQQPPQSAARALQRGLHLADLYNWAGAAEDFKAAEQMFLTAGDQRNALYARLGKIRATIEQLSLPVTSAQLDSELESNALLQNDKRLRMFCLIVKGDIDGETNSGAMRRDWEQVQALAKELGDKKWLYRSLAQLGIAAFYDGDLPTATKNVSAALIAAASNGDAGARIRFTSAIGLGLLQAKMYEQALTYFDNALKFASVTPDAGYQFLTNEGRLEALIALKQFDTANRLADEALTRARQERRPGQEADILALTAKIALARGDENAALSDLDRALTVARASGLPRPLAEAQSQMAEIYRHKGELQQAERLAELAATSTQESGDAWAVPQRLQTLADLQISRGEYANADRVLDRAGSFIDGMIGNYSGIFEKTALIRAASDLYAKHFALVADKFNDPTRAYDIVEQVRGRVLTDLLLSGSTSSDQSKKHEHELSEMRLKLMAAHSSSDVRRLREQIFVAEQARWAAPGVSILKRRSNDSVGLSTLEHALSPSALLLEYVISEPRSYCLAISRSGARIVALGSSHYVEALALAYLKAVKAKQPAMVEGRRLYDALLQPLTEVAQGKTLVVVRDGLLHLLPFDAFMDGAGLYVAQTHTVVYAPSASSFYLLTNEGRHASQRRPLLAVGDVPYGSEDVKLAGITRGYEASGIFDLPASKDEVLAANAAFHNTGNTLLLGSAATESAFKRAGLANYGLVHLAVHGLADKTDPDRAALFLLSDPATGEDGILHASEIVQLRVAADVIVLSACDTAVGPLEGEEGIATLSRAFLLAGARTVISTLWSVDDTFSLFLMKQFYKHLASGESPADALAAAKRDMLHKYHEKAVPYYWAGFTFEGAADETMIHQSEKERATHDTKPAATHRNPDIH
jgi:CHAT domain-containing protein